MESGAFELGVALQSGISGSSPHIPEAPRFPLPHPARFAAENDGAIRELCVER